VDSTAVFLLAVSSSLSLSGFGTWALNLIENIGGVSVGFVVQRYTTYPVLSA